jgi:hypothetical protein
MRVWVYPEKVYEELGAKRWEVEWQTVSPKALKRIAEAEARGEYDEVDIDSDLISHFVVYPHRAKGLAMAYARKMVNCANSAFASVMVQEQVVDWYVEEDRIAEWSNIGETIYVD